MKNYKYEFLFVLAMLGVGLLMFGAALSAIPLLYLIAGKEPDISFWFYSIYGLISWTILFGAKFYFELKTQ